MTKEKALSNLKEDLFQANKELSKLYSSKEKDEEQERELKWTISNIKKAIQYMKM